MSDIQIHIDDYWGNYIPEIMRRIPLAYNLNYETIMPGGMSIASCFIPWQVQEHYPRLIGGRFIVYDEAGIVWWGRVNTIGETVTSGMSKLKITAYGPWQRAATIPFTQSYPASVGWTGSDIIRNAIHGNMPDVAVETDRWNSLGLSLSAVAWSDSNVQSVITECLRFGDTTTSPWSLIILPPVTVRQDRGQYYFYSSCESLSNFTATGAAAVDTTIRQRGIASISLTSGVDGSAWAYKSLASTKTTVTTVCWFYVSPDSGAAQHEYIEYQQSGGTAIVRLITSSTDIIQVYNVPAAATYTATGNCTLGRACWHKLLFTCTISATVGVVTVQLDDQTIISQTALNTGSTAIGRIMYGPSTINALARRMWIDSTIVYSTAASILTTATTADETLPEPYLFKIDTSSYDFTIDMPIDYTISESTEGLINHIYVKYGSAYTSPVFDTTSVSRYGSYPSVETLSKISEVTVAGAYRDRMLAQRAEPRRMLQPFTIYQPPAGYDGNRIPLSTIRSGMRFRIRERSDLGTLYIAHTRYQRGELGQQELCQITPTEPPTDISLVVARTTPRSWI